MFLCVTLWICVFKLLQAQKLLDDIVGKSLEIVHSSIPEPDDEAVSNEEEVGVRLFKNAPRGIVFDHKGKWIPSSLLEDYNAVSVAALL